MKNKPKPQPVKVPGLLAIKKKRRPKNYGLLS